MKLSGIWWTLRLTLMTFIGFWTSIGMILVFSPMLFCFWIVSRVVYWTIRLKHGKTFTKAGGLDIIQGFESQKSKPFINAIGRYKGKVDLDKFLVKFEKFILDLENEKGHLRYRKFRQNFEKIYGYHVFKDHEEFDLKNHIRKIELRELFPEKFPRDQEESNQNGTPLIQSPYGNGIVNLNGFESAKLYSKSNEESETSEELPEVPWEELIGRLMTKYGSFPIRKGIPQWEILYVEEKEFTSMVFKLSHAYSDGVYFLRFYLEHIGDHPVKCNLPYNYHQPKFSRRFLDLFWAFCLLPFGLSRLSFNYEKNPLHGPELSGEKMYMISKSIPLEDIKDLKRESKSNMNAIFFTCLANAIASHFQLKYCDVENVIALIPISLQDLKKPIKLKNQFGLKGILLPTFLNKENPQSDSRNPRSALRRLHEVQESCNRTNSDPSFLAIHWLLVFVCSLLPSKIIDSLFSTKGLTTSMSNVAGPQEGDFMITDCKKTEFCFFIPDRDPLGMGVSVAGFDKRVRIGLMIDRALMATEEEGHQFLNAFLQELKNLHNELQTMKSRNIIENEEYTSLMIPNSA